jgi:hypothetical protein
MTNNDAIFKLKSINADTEPEQKLRDLVKHIQDQMNNTYMYWVGEWANGRKARSTKDGQFVGKEEVINYLNHK